MMLVSVKNLWTICKFTFVELYKSRILLNVVLMGFFLILIASVASEFTYGVPEKVALDFGLGLLTISLVGVGTFMGSTLISTEMENRTLYMILSRPVQRHIFLIGRILGLTGILFVNAMILCLFTFGLFKMLGGEITSLMYYSVLFAFLEGLLVMLIVVFLSLISNTVLSIMMTITIYLAGHGIEAVKETSMVLHRESLARFINIYSEVMPNFTKLNVKKYVFYENLVTVDFIQSSLLYSILYCVLLVIISSMIFSKKELS